MGRDKFDVFMEIVQNEAKKRDSRFFISSGEGHELITETMEGEDLFGWLIPLDRAKEFISEKSRDEFDEEKWEKFETFAIWKLKGANVSVNFQDF